jgi:hypothetical protein
MLYQGCIQSHEPFYFQFFYYCVNTPPCRCLDLSWDNRLVDFCQRYVSRISVTRTSLQITSKLRQDVARDVPIAGWFKTTVDK